jgi:hypothetical protein
MLTLAQSACPHLKILSASALDPLANVHRDRHNSTRGYSNIFVRVLHPDLYVSDSEKD